MFKYIYYFISLFVYILALPYLLLKSRQDKYKDAIPAKFFLKDNPKFQKNKIWFHCCSMGEVKAIQPLLKNFNKEDINISVITNTGYETAKIFTKNVRYLPFEIFLPFWVEKQKYLIVMEAELWYMLFLSAKQKSIKTILINARISDRSYKNYQRFRFLYKHIFKSIDIVFAQSEVDKQRLQNLGAKHIETIGNIKLVNLPKITKQYKKPNSFIITAASTHEGEEKLILKAWQKKYGKLIIVPRHPERFDSVYNLIKQYCSNTDISYHKFSEQNDFNSDIVLVDLMGELNNIYAISNMVVLGGGFVDDAGGHNPIEPAFFHTILLSGKIIFNQKSLFEAINDYYLIEQDELNYYFSNIKNLKRSSLSQIGSIEPILKCLDNFN